MNIERPKFAEMILKARKEPQYALSWRLEAAWDEAVGPINKLLIEGVDVFGKPDHASPGRVGYYVSEFQCKSDTHKALLINIQPIKKETAEDVLRDWVKLIDSFSMGPTADYEYNFIKRAKQVLGDK